jgi:hypothetical protein
MRARRFPLVAIVGMILAADAVAIRGAAPGLTAVAATPDPVVARRDADAFRVKLGEISRRGGEAATVRPEAARTTVTESEVNGYLALDVADDLPAGVVSPNVVMLGQGRASGQAVVDLDRVRQDLGASSVLNPLSYLRGRLPVVATGTLESHDGTARLLFESATVSGVRVPKFVLQQIVSYYSKSETFPSGINLDDPFQLPARIREIQVERGRAIVVQ